MRRGERFLYHKTTRRQVYERALKAVPGCDDVLLVNDENEVTESTIANVVVRDAVFAAELQASLQAAFDGAAREIRIADQRRRSWLARFAIAAAYSLVRMLIGVTRYAGKQYSD